MAKKKKVWTVRDACDSVLHKYPSLAKNKKKNQLCLRVQGVMGAPVKFTTVDRVHRDLVPRRKR